MNAYKRNADIAQNDGADNVIPQPATNTREGRIVDLSFAVDEAKRVRRDVPATVNDAAVANALIAEHSALTEVIPAAEAITRPILTEMRRLQDVLGRLERQQHPDRLLALARNANVHNAEARLCPVPRCSDLEVPQPFPATLRAMNALRAGQLRELLIFYGAPADGPIPDQREKLRALLGIPLSAQ